jgi:hypothetical protein
MILVVYSGRGLVVNGSPNLELLNVLYWVVLVTYIVIFFFVYSPTMDIGEVEGICLKTSFLSAKQWPVVYFFIALDWTGIEIFEKMKRNSVRRQCSNMTQFAALGGTRRRNIFTGAETKLYCFLLFAIFLLQDFIITMSLKEEIVDRKSAATLYYCMWSLILVFCFALFLPILHLAKSSQRFPEFWVKYQEGEIKDFYVRKPVLDPRRAKNEINTLSDVLDSEGGSSYVNKKKNRRKISKSVRRKRKDNIKGHLHTIIELPDVDI